MGPRDRGLTSLARSPTLALVGRCREGSDDRSRACTADAADAAIGCVAANGGARMGGGVACVHVAISPATWATMDGSACTWGAAALTATTRCSPRPSPPLGGGGGAGPPSDDARDESPLSG